MSSKETDEVLALIALAETENSGGRIGLRLSEIAADASDAPSLAFEELSVLALEQTESLPTLLPDTTLYRARVCCCPPSSTESAEAAYFLRTWSL